MRRGVTAFRFQGDVIEMANKPARESPAHWEYDYSAAIANAVAWLGDRYLVAKPINVTAADRRGSRRIHISRPPALPKKE